ncbi:hypothetical protein FB45DRAFT_929992 [Roridomyces roridus]|uniref:F-box domain-containing protein n=1 Tax=Roridomyces roridus TaxID=1738132 RepID=A0AAD7FF69_9AGAR|nr:hypothetical protein FB45DRAFT_929992 [Roridomyces roridus]
MVLTRRAHRCLFRWLPNELLSLVIAFTSQDTKLALCSACKLFHHLVVISLYRDVKLETTHKFDAFLLSLSLNAIHVFTLTTHIISEELHDPEFSERYILLNNLTQLKKLDLYSPRGCVGILRHCTFSRLSWLIYRAAASFLSTETIYPFMLRHPDISHLRLPYDVAANSVPQTSRGYSSCPLHWLSCAIPPMSRMLSVRGTMKMISLSSETSALMESAALTLGKAVPSLTTCRRAPRSGEHKSEGGHHIITSPSHQLQVLATGCVQHNCLLCGWRQWTVGPPCCLCVGIWERGG